MDKQTELELGQESQYAEQSSQDDARFKELKRHTTAMRKTFQTQIADLHSQLAEAKAEMQDERDLCLAHEAVAENKLATITRLEGALEKIIKCCGRTASMVVADMKHIAAKVLASTEKEKNNESS